jgi:hypothetical protein
MSTQSEYTNKPLINIRDVPTDILYRHQKAYYRKKWSSDPDFRAAKNKAQLDYYHKQMQDPAYAEKRREAAKKAYQKKKQQKDNTNQT